MRKLILALATAAGLVLVGGAPAFAAPAGTVTSNGSYSYLDSYSPQCGTYGSCEVSAQVNSDGTAIVCVDLVKRRKEVYGCNETVSASAISFSRSGSASFTDIPVTLSNGTTVLVSAQDQPTGEPASSSRGTGSGSFEGCTYHYTYSETDTPVAGTLSINGSQYQETGYVGSGRSNNVSKSC